MFLGTHTPRLDEKGRLFLPAKFRDRLADGLVVTRGQERCLYVFPMDEFVRVADTMRAAPVTSKAVRDYLRVFLSGASDELPDKQGRVTIPAGLREYAGLARDCTVIGAGSRVEVWDTRRVDRLPRDHRAGLRRAGRGGDPGSPLTRPTTRAQHDPPAPAARSPPAPRPGAPSPVPGRTSRAVGDLTTGTTAPAPHHRHARHPSTDPTRRRPTDEHTRQRRGAARPRPARPHPRAARPGAAASRGRSFVDGTLGMGGHTEARAGAPARPRAAVGIDRDPRRWRLAGERLAAFGDRFTGVHAVYDELPRRPRRPRAAAPCDAVLFDLGVSSLQLDEADRGFAYRHDAPLDMRMDQSERHHRGRRPQHLRRRRPRRGSCATTARSASPAGSPRPSSASAGGSRSPPRPGWSSCCEPAIPAASQQERRPPGQAHLPGPADRGQRRAARRWETRPAGRGRRARRRRPDRRPQLPLAGGPADQAAVRRGVPAARTPPGLPVELPEHAPYLRLLTRGAEEPSAAEKDTNPRAASARLRAAERTRATKGQHP